MPIAAARFEPGGVELAAHDIMRRTLLAQGAYLVASGLWPFVHLRSFVAVTGPKRDVWLVRTVGALALAIGVPLIHAALRDEPTRESELLADTSALAFAAVDVGYVAAGRIGPIYLCDAVVEAAFLAARRL
jgi:hypothetical protein